ncbi:sds23/moc1 [Camillea tinctor]|nr:sds23/moc1 [Camillea tinctor]
MDSSNHTKDTSISPPPPQRTPSTSSLHKHSHRSSFAENLRGLPPSPRNQRHPSLTQSAFHDLLNHPPAPRHQNPRFAGRDWRDVAIGELVSKDDVKWVNMDTSVEEASMALIKNTQSNVVLIRENASSIAPISTFDYSDLNAYVLVVVGLAHPSEDLVELYSDIAQKAQARTSIPLRDIQPICRKETLVTLPGDEDLTKAIEVFGSGIHRIYVTNHSSEVVGILSQLKLMEFFWNEGVNFRVIDDLYPRLMRDLGIGSQQIIAVNAESPLLHGTCLHFISIILTERGAEKGEDSYPVFHINPYSTLAHTVAKLVATRSHRMWVVECASPSPSAPGTPSLGPTVLMPNTPSSSQTSLIGTHFPSVQASASGSHLSGRLTGVVTLTDILNLFARTTGLNPSDPNEQRARRRRSSSSSVRPSLDSSRPSLDIRR